MPDELPDGAPATPADIVITETMNDAPLELAVEVTANRPEQPTENSRPAEPAPFLDPSA